VGSSLGPYAAPMVLSEMGGAGNRTGSRSSDLLWRRQDSLERYILQTSLEL